MRFDDWGFPAAIGRDALDYSPRNGGFGPVAIKQYEVTQAPDWLTQDAPYDTAGDITGLPAFPSANMDGTVNFYEWAYTTPPGSTFNHHWIDRDGDHWIPRDEMAFGFYDAFLYRDTTGTNPDQDFDTRINFQPVALSDAIGWCGYTTHPLALEPMGGQVAFDVAFEVFFGDGPLVPGTGLLQVIPGFQMHSYGTLEVEVFAAQGSRGDFLYRADAVMNNTNPALGRDAAHPWGYADPDFYNHVSFMGGGAIPTGVWVFKGGGGPYDVTVAADQGTPGTAAGEVRADGAVWHINGFSDSAFMLRADAIRDVEWFDEEFYGPAPAIIPEPMSMALVGSGLLFLLGRRLRKA
jgi:hypothetical protein